MIYMFFDLLWVSYNCAKFHHCRICVTDLREMGLFGLLKGEQPQKGPSCIGSRLQIIFFLGMFCKLVFYKLQNMRWLSNIIFGGGAWSKWLKLPYTYGTHWHNVTEWALLSKLTPHKNGTKHHKNGILYYWKYYEPPADITYPTPPPTISPRRVIVISI